MLFEIILGIVTIGYLFYWYVTRTFNYWKNKNVVGPKPIPLFGNTKELAFRRQTFAEIIRDIYNSYPEEKVVGIYTMTTPCLIVRDLDIIKHVLIKDFDKFSDRGVELSKDGLGANLFHSESETWQVLRKKFTPLFTSGKLKNMTYLMVEKADKLVEHVNKLCESNNEIEVSRILNKYTISTISSCAFGIDIELDKERMEQLHRINELIFVMNRGVELEMLYPGSLKKLSVNLFPKIINTFFNGLVDDVITQRNGKPIDRHDFIDLILEMKQQKVISGGQKYGSEAFNLELTNSVIAAQAFVFYAAGNETSSTTMTNMLYQLALNPDVQEKLVQEIDKVLEESKGELTYDSVMSMKYLTQVFDETLRMYPIVDPLQRRAKENYMIPGLNMEVEKGKLVYISSLGIHYDEKYYPNPLEFDPERFNVENSNNRNPATYLPFGIGPRNCIGLRFGKLQSLIGIVKILSNFRVEPSKNTPKPIKFDPHRYVLGPLNGVHLNIIPRTLTFIQ